jgi:hypothetical protein
VPSGMAAASSRVADWLAAAHLHVIQNRVGDLPESGSAEDPSLALKSTYTQKSVQTHTLPLRHVHYTNLSPYEYSFRQLAQSLRSVAG